MSPGGPCGPLLAQTSLRDLIAQGVERQCPPVAVRLPCARREVDESNGTVPGDFGLVTKA
jgi:hypothetical protein